MAVDTFIAYVGVYSSVDDAESDYDFVKDLHTQAGLIDAYDAAVVERKADGKVKIVKKHETPTASAACSAVGSASPPGSSSCCSRSPPSVAASSPRPPRAAQRSERSPGTRRPA